MQRDGDTAEYRTLSADCDPCTGFAESVERIYSAGGSIETEGADIIGITQLDEAVFQVQVRESPTRYTETAGGPVKRFPGGPVILRVYVKHRASGWVVTNYTQRPGGSS